MGRREQDTDDGGPFLRVGYDAGRRQTRQAGSLKKILLQKSIKKINVGMEEHRIPRRKKGRRKLGLVTCIINKQEHRFHNRYLLCWITAGRKVQNPQLEVGQIGERKRTK